MSNYSQAELLKRAVKEDPELEIWDKEHSRSVYNLCGPQIQEAIDKIPKEFFVMSEKQLDKLLDPELSASQMRVAFWSEYHRCQYAGAGKMNMAHVYNKICAKQTFYDSYVSNPMKLAWILRPPSNYLLGMEAILGEGLKVMYAAVRAKNIIHDGRIVDAKNLEAILKIIDKTIVAIHGMPTIRHETKALVHNVNQNIAPPAGERSIEDLRKELAELEAKKARQLAPSTLEEFVVPSSDVREVVPLSGEKL